MDETVRRLTTPEECEQFIKNVQERYPGLAIEARRKAVELRAAAHGAQTAAEKEALRAVYAHEEALSVKKRATGSPIKRHQSREKTIPFVRGVSSSPSVVGIGVGQTNQ